MNLLNSQEWGRFLDLAKQQAEHRKGLVAFTNCTNMDMVLQQEYVKGEIAGLYFMQAYLPTILEAIEQQITDRQMEKDNEDT